MVKTELAHAASSASLHHGRQDDERACVDRYHDQDKNDQHQADRDEYPAQRPCVGRLSVVDLIPRLTLHDRGLPGRGGCHTSSQPSNRSTGG
jgi:hypothetical protein